MSIKILSECLHCPKQGTITVDGAATVIVYMTIVKVDAATDKIYDTIVILCVAIVKVYMPKERVYVAIVKICPPIVCQGQNKEHIGGESGNIAC